MRSLTAAHFFSPMVAMKEEVMHLIRTQFLGRRHRFRGASFSKRQINKRAASRTYLQPKPERLNGAGSYDGEAEVNKLLRELERTHLILESQCRRFSRNNERGNIILIYYSVVLILYSVAIAFFRDILCVKLLEFSSIMLSIGALVYSLINGNANYLARALRLERTIEDVQDITEQVEELLPASKEFGIAACCAQSKQGGCEYDIDHPDACTFCAPCKRLQELKRQFNEIKRKSHLCDCRDLFYMAKSLCTRYGIPDSLDKGGGIQAFFKRLFKPAIFRYGVDNISSLFVANWDESMNQKQRDVYGDLKKVIHPYTIVQQSFYEIRARIRHVLLYITPTAVFLFAWIIKIAAKGYLGDFAIFNFLKTLNEMFGG